MTSRAGGVNSMADTTVANTAIAMHNTAAGVRRILKGTQRYFTATLQPRRLTAFAKASASRKLRGEDSGQEAHANAANSPRRAGARAATIGTFAYPKTAPRRNCPTTAPNATSVRIPAKIREKFRAKQRSSSPRGAAAARTAATTQSNAANVSIG